jgi:hypothetical protein
MHHVAFVDAPADWSLHHMYFTVTNAIIHAGNTYSIKNVGSGTARVFFSQAREMMVQEYMDE